MLTYICCRLKCLANFSAERDVFVRAVGLSFSRKCFNSRSCLVHCQAAVQKSMLGVCLLSDQSEQHMFRGDLHSSPVLDIQPLNLSKHEACIEQDTHLKRAQVLRLLLTEHDRFDRSLAELLKHCFNNYTSSTYACSDLRHGRGA